MLAVSLLAQAGAGSLDAQAPSVAAQGRWPGAAPAIAAAPTDSGTAAFALHAEARLVSRYIWRGFDDSRNTASVQPFVELTLPLGFTANAFGSSGVDRHMQLDEAQLGVGYKRTLGDWELGAGYLHYILPGTETEPSPGAHPLMTTTSGEYFLALTRNWEKGYATLTYSRGNRAGKGNSVNVWVEQDVATADGRWTAQPYLQLDYLDEYGAPAGFENRFSMIEIGMPVLFQLGPVQLLAAAQVSFIPSPWIRIANAGAGASRDVALPWFSIGIVFGRD
jgi:hypothetical protein